MEASYDLKKLGTGVRLKVKGNLGIANANEFKEFLLSSVPENGNCTLFLKELEGFDLTTIQILAALNLKQKKNNNSLTVFFPENSFLKDLLDKFQLEQLIKR